MKKIYLEHVNSFLSIVKETVNTDCIGTVINTTQIRQHKLPKHEWFFVLFPTNVTDREKNLYMNFQKGIDIILKNEMNPICRPQIPKLISQNRNE